MNKTTEATKNGTQAAPTLDAESKLEVLRQKRQLYQQHQYDAELEYKIASKLDDEKAKEAQMGRLKRIEKILAFLDEELIELTGERVVYAVREKPDGAD